MIANKNAIDQNTFLILALRPTVFMDGINCRRRQGLIDSPLIMSMLIVKRHDSGVIHGVFSFAFFFVVVVWRGREGYD